MKFKLDENLGSFAAAILAADGHDVATVPGERLSGSSDRKLLRICVDEGRCLVTLDHEFGNPLIFPPRDYCGIVLLRVRGRANLNEIRAAIRTLVGALRDSSRA